MLTASEVKPFLIHEDRPVRDAAIDYSKGAGICRTPGGRSSRPAATFILKWVSDRPQALRRDFEEEVQLATRARSLIRRGPG